MSKYENYLQRLENGENPTRLMNEIENMKDYSQSLDKYLRENPELEKVYKLISNARSL